MKKNEISKTKTDRSIDLALHIFQQDSISQISLKWAANERVAMGG